MSKSTQNDRGETSLHASSRPKRRPRWLTVRAPTGEAYHDLKRLMRSKALNTICEAARCPNIGECWGHGTATFLILGDVCTRSCRFCDVTTGRPAPIDWDEPQRVAQAVQAMDLKHVVITSVNRDEREDGGAPIFARCIQCIRDVQPGCTVEVLIPDFKGNIDALRIVTDARPDILNHNVETVKRIFRVVQPQDHYEWAMSTLDNARKLWAAAVTKSGIMVGLGETFDEVVETMEDLRRVQVDILTVGQYLQPTRKHMPIDRYYTPDEFAEFERLGKEMGFKWVESGPLVRSSYNAEAQARALSSLWVSERAGEL